MQDDPGNLEFNMGLCVPTLVSQYDNTSPLHSTV